MRIDERFDQTLDSRWCLTETGKAQVVQNNAMLKLTVLPTSTGYSNAQIDDYSPHPLSPTGLRQIDARRQRLSFQWRPPLRLSVSARASGELHGTAGFGFWNHPFAPGERGFRLPQSVWFFFGSPPNNMALAKGVPGHGWKVATFDARRWQFLALLPSAPITVLLMRIPALYNALWPIGQRAIGVSEQLLDSTLLADWHTYGIDWRTDGATFTVDGSVIHEAPHVPRNALGFAAWIDNQYAVVTPQGHLGNGVLPLVQEQSLALRHIQIEMG